MKLKKQTAKERFLAMQSFNMVPVVKLLLREGWLPTQEVAEQNCTALLQWLAGHAMENHQQPYVMMHGTVDKAFHAFLLHTRLFRKFCAEHVGYFINHTPLDTEQANEFEIMGGISYTVDYLNAAFGNELSPALKEWSRDASIAAVSCVRNGWDTITAEEENLPNLEKFWESLEFTESLVSA